MSSQLILVVEESEHTRAFLAEQLAADGYEILLAESRRHALALLGTHRPQLVLADLNGQTLGLLDAVRRGAGDGRRVRPAHADDRADRARGRARARSRVRPRRRRRGRQAVLLPGAARTDPRAAAPGTPSRGPRVSAGSAR